MFCSRRARLVGLGAALVLAVVLSFAAGRYVRAAAGAPGSEADPLVTQSYVDQYTQWRVVSLEAGQKLIAQGGTEIILRAGTAKAIASPSGGLADVTAGRDLGQGVAIASNHLLIVPRSDGRGVQAVSAVVLLVKGPFGVQ